MRLYSASKPPSPINSDWIHWTNKSHFKNIEADSNQISALLFITRNKEIEIIYKPTPIINDANDQFEGIMGNMFDDGSTPAIIKIDGDDIGACTTIQVFPDLPEAFRPEFALLADSVKDTEWQEAKMELALIVIPTMAPLPYGTDIKSTELDDDFIDEMQKLSPEHGFWAKMMVDAHEQYASDYDTSQVVKNLSATKSSTRRDPCNAATKGFREATIAHSGPIVLATRPRNKHEREQKIIKDFFYRNPTPARPEPVEEDEDDGDDAPEIPIQATTAAPIQGATATFNPTAANSSAEFYSQLLETLKTINQTAPVQQKIVVESREHEESVDLAKLQTSMLKLFYVKCDIDWDEGTVKNVTLATFSKGFKDLLGRTATVQEAQFANLLNTIFKTQPDDDDDELTNPLERLMSLSVFPKKFNKAHLNASFQSADLESNMMYKNPSINPFHYAPQDCRALVKAATVEIEEERNQFNWRVNEKDKKQISSVIEGVGRIESIDDVSRTCANMCGVMLAIVDVSKTKPLLYQVAYKFIKMIENKKTQTWMRENSDSIAHVPFVLMGKLHQCFQHLASFSQNSINTNKVELNDNTLNVKQVAVAVKLISKFFKKMTEHIEDSSVPKDIPPFARTFFVEQTGNVTAVVPSLVPTERNMAAKTPAAGTEGGKRKSEGGDTQPRKKRETSDKSLAMGSDKSLAMGIFHVKKGTPVSKALPDKAKLKDGASICLDFCCHERKCKYPHALCKNGKHYTNWKNVPDDDKAVLLSHMNETSLLWFDEETMKKHKVDFASEYSHLLGDATGPKPKPAAST
jgi:hypothetical protein